MKPKKQQPAERKQSAAPSASSSTGDGVGESTQSKAIEPTAAAGSGAAVVTALASTPAAATVSAPSSSSKKPVKRLQSKAKDLTVGSSVESAQATANSAASASGSAGGKLSEKLQSTNAAGGSVSVPVQSSKSKPSSIASNAAGGKGAAAASGPTEQQTGSSDGPTVDNVTPSHKLSPAGKGSKAAAKASKADSTGSSAPSSTSGKASGEAKKKPSSAAAKAASTGGVAGSVAKKSNSQAEKRKQSTAGAGINPSLEASTVGAGAAEAVTTGAPAPAADRLREKEKKIQKELKNLGISDKTLHQIDASSYLRTTDESVNPSISEMVKTKSRTTVSQAKYSESQLAAAGSSSTSSTGNGGRKSSVTSEDASGASATEGQQDKPGQGGGKTKKSVTLKLDSLEEKSTPAKGGGKTSKEGTGDSTPKATPKGGQKAGGEGSKTAAKAPSKGGGSSATSSNKSSKKSAAATSEGKQPKKGAAGTPVAAVPKPQVPVEDRKAAAAEGSKQVTFETSPLAPGSACPGRSSSVEPDDPEEKNEAVQIQIDSIVKALEQEEDSDGAAGDKKDTSADDDKKDPSAKLPTISGPAGAAKKQQKGDSDPKPPPRKPALKKSSSGSHATKAPSKESDEKRKGTAFAAEKKEVTFKEQPPVSPAKRKHVKKPKASGEESCGEPKPAKAAKVKASSSKPKPSPAAAEGSSKPKMATDLAKPPGGKAATGSELSISGKQQEQPVPVPVGGASEVTNDTQKISSESQSNSQDPPRVETNSRKEVVTAAPPVVPPQRDRSSTENDDDLPLRQLQVKAQPELLPPQSDSHPKAPSSVANDKEPAEKPVEVQSSTSKNKSSAQTCAGPILASLLKSGPVGKSAKRTYVRKPPAAGSAAPGSGSKSGKPSATDPSLQTPEAVGGANAMDPRKMEKKDVYDFDDSDSDAGALVKGVKPSFKRKSSVDLCQSSREDISQLDDSTSLAMQDASQTAAAAVEQPARPGQDSDREAETPAASATVAKASPVRCPAKKQKKRPTEQQPQDSSKSMKLKTELRSGSSSSSEPEDGRAGSPLEKGRPLDQVPEAKVKKKVPAKRLKQEPAKAHGEDSSPDDEVAERAAEQCDEAGEEDEEEEVEGEELEGDDSDGYSSTDTVRTRIAKKRQSAKKRNLKLYGFWSGPKRHRVASLNAIAKVHCLYENERPAFEASLMKQSSGSRVIRTITKDGERIKKERICDDESVEGGDDEGASGTEVASEEKGTATATVAAAPSKSGSKQERKQEQPAPVLMASTIANAEQPKEEAKPMAMAATAKVSVKQEPAKKEPTSNQDSSSESSEEEPVVTRTLRCVPGLRGAGKHWDPDASSMESDIEQLPDSDETYAQGKDTDPIRKRKVKKKVVRKSKAKTASQTKQEKEKEKEKEKDKEKEKGATEGAKGANEKSEQKSQPKPPVKKIKKELKALLTDSERQDDGAASSSSTGSEKGTTVPAPSSTKPKAPEEGGTKKRKREGPKVEEAANEVVTDYKEYIGKKRMASLNATAMLAATYEVQRTLYRNTDSSDSECSAEKAPKSKKAKDQKDAAAAKEKAAEAKEKKELAAKEKLEAEEAAKKEATALVEPPAASPPDRKQVDLSIGLAAASEANASTSAGQQEVLTKKKKVVIKTEPMRDRKDDPLEVKREIEEPRPVSSNLVIAQDTEVTITGVYATLGTNQEAYCKMQYRVQQSVTEERLVRPGEVPPKSYTPLSALSSMRPPNDQTLSTPPLFVPPVQCDSPLLVHGPPRPFYPPPTSSSGSSSAFCAPLPHDSPGYYQPAGPLISPHLLPPTTSQHGPPVGSLVGSKSGGGGPEHSEHSPLHHPGPAHPPASTTADSTDSDVLLTGGDLAPRVPAPYAHSHRYGPATGPPPPPQVPPPPSAANLYQRPMQMHCPPPPPTAYLPANYYGSPYGQPPPPPHHEMYYAHAYPAHFYPKFAPHQYYPTSRRYYPGPPGPPGTEHLYEQAPPGGAPVGPAPPPPPPPPSGAQLVPAGPQGPQHLDHYPYPYPGYGSPGPGSGGQCYSRNPLQHSSPYMDAHYTTNCPCPMQCPKNVNAGSLIGIKASKGPVATNNNTNNSTSSTNSTNSTNHIVQSQSSTMTSTEPITISSSSSSSSSTSSSASSASPAPLDIHAPIVAPVSEPPAPTVPPSAASHTVASHGYHHHHHHPALQRPPVEMHHGHQYHHHNGRQGAQGPPVEYLPPGAAPPASAAVPVAVTTTASNPSVPPSSVHSSNAKPTESEYPTVSVTTAPSNGDRHNSARLCYKPEQQLIKPENMPEPHLTGMHYGSPYHHHPHYHHPGLGYYHHPGLSGELKDDLHGPPLSGGVPTPYSVPGKMAHHEASAVVLPQHNSPTRGAAKAGANQMQPPRPLTPPDVLLDDAKRKNLTDDKQHTTIKAIVKQEIEEFKPDCLLAVADGAVCKKENFEETGPAMTPELPLHESIVIKKDHDEQKPALRLPDESKPAAAELVDDGSFLKPLLQPHHPQPNVHLSSHHHHHSASTNLLHHHLDHQLHPADTAANQAPAPEVEADSKCALTELVLTTEASLASKVSAAAVTTASVTVTTTTSSSNSSSGTTTTTTTTSTLPALVTTMAAAISSSDGCTASHHAKDISSDSSISVSDSIVPSIDGDGHLEHDPASPVSIIPASTVKRRPLLVACKKSTTKQSPPNSYKNLIKRTNGDGDNADDAAPVDDRSPDGARDEECAARDTTVELSDEEEEEEDEDEEEEEDDEEEEEDEEEDDDEDEDDGEGEEEELEGKRVAVEDVEGVEMLEQARQEAAQRQRVKRGRIASKIAICKRSSKMPAIGHSSDRRKSMNIGSVNSSSKLLLLTHQNRRRVKKPGTPVSRKLLKRVHRVFRTSIESLRKLPPRLGGGLLPARHQRFVRKLRLSKSPVHTMTQDSRTGEAVDELIDKQNASVVAPLHSCESAQEDSQIVVSSVIIAEEQPPRQHHEEIEPTEPLSVVAQTTLVAPVSDGAMAETTAILEPSSTATKSGPGKTISNVDRTIDLVARGYFSEPEILPIDLKMHSRGWLKKVKQQQQQEGRSHSEQSRGAKRDRSSGGASTDSSAGCTKKTKKAAPVAALPVNDRVTDLKNGTVEAEKKSKSKTKKVTPETANGTSECDKLLPDGNATAGTKSKKKSSSKDSKKESKKKSKKQKLQDGLSSEEHRQSDVAVAGAAGGSSTPIEDELSCVAYQRATSTPIPTNGSACIPEIGERRGLTTPCVEDELRKANQLDDSVTGCQLDQSSVIDDRETDFDDAATMLVEDDVASVDTSVLITRHNNNNNNNNNSAIIDKNNLGHEQQLTAGMIVPEQRPLQAIIADGKEGSELEPPEGMEPFLDDPMDETDDGVLRLQSPLYQQQRQQQQELFSQPPPTELNRQQSTASDAMQLDYADEDDEDDDDALLDDDGHCEELRQKRSSNRSTKRRRSRSKSSKKFSSKKRHRPSANRCEIEEIIVPRKSTSIPRWSNGWTWEGQPFQGKVFLNSDDAPVLRTCYPAMRHSEGDIIRPRDCVLLRAGSKRAELPYVAKVAHLWENPEDGEMMMSLLWYYRPEHTEQGRQLADGPDEVFASRHKDHNSVACIEDKCYVLTFSEYCRFRRQLKGLEENVEEQPSIVPPLRRENPRLPPPIVAPELVMYCQRVYEFRLKRLLKSTS